MIKFWDAQADYRKHKDEINAAIERVLESGKLVLGASPEIEQFEASFAEYVGAKHAIMCGGGTHALYLAYRVLDIGPGDEVICPSHTFVATIDQIIALGATPVMVDVDDTGLIDPVEIAKHVTSRTKAIVPVHLEGKVCDMDSIMEIARNYRLLVVEDAAQAVGATHKDRFVGTIGDVGCYSMYPAKILGSVGNSGMCVTNDDYLAERLRMLRCNSNIGKNPNLEAEIGVQLEPDAVQAAVLNVRLPYHEENVARRASVAERYDKAFSTLPITLPLRQTGRVYQDYVIRVPERKAEFLKHLVEKEIGFIGHNLTPNHLYNALGGKNLPNTERYIRDQVRIPCNANLSDSEVEQVIEAVTSFYA